MGLLRTLFAISVVFAHSIWHPGDVLIGGKNAVQIFYIISGFLMSYVLVEAKSYSSIKSFYFSRWLRLWPIYIVVALVTCAARYAADLPFFSIFENIPTSADIVLIFSNIFMFGQDWIVLFSGIFEKVPNLSDGLLVPQAWSLGVELTFYLIAPFILHRTKLVLALLAASISLRIIFIFLGFGLNDPWSYRFFPTELALFLLGALSHQFLLPIYKHKFGVYLQSAAAKGTYFFILISIFFYFIRKMIGDSLSDFFLLVTFIFVAPLAFTYSSTSKLDAKIGDLSYPIYICHYLMISFFARILWRFEIKSLIVITIMNVLLSIACAYLLNKFIGQKVEIMRKKIKLSSWPLSKREKTTMTTSAYEPHR